MKKTDLASKLARKRKISRAQAADRLDGLVHKILKTLRQGKTASLPGLGALQPGRQTRFQADAKLPVKPEGRG